MTHSGTSAKYIDALRKVALVPVKDYGLKSIRTMFSTGSRSRQSFDYVYEAIKHDLLSSIAGGTDIVSCFVLGNPTLPVWRGEIQCQGSEWRWKCSPTMASQRRRASAASSCARSRSRRCRSGSGTIRMARRPRRVFRALSSVWCHGDYIEITQHGGVIIHGRSDATLNPGGVRIGTAEIYRQVEQLPEVVESLVIGQDWPPGEVGDVRVVLFVKLREGLFLDAALRTGSSGTCAPTRPSARAGEDRAGPRHPAHQERQDRRARRTRRGSRARAEEPRGARESGRR